MPGRPFKKEGAARSAPSPDFCRRAFATFAALEVGTSAIGRRPRPTTAGAHPDIAPSRGLQELDDATADPALGVESYQVRGFRTGSSCRIRHGGHGFRDPNRRRPAATGRAASFLSQARGCDPEGRPGRRPAATYWRRNLTPELAARAGWLIPQFSTPRGRSRSESREPARSRPDRSRGRRRPRARSASFATRPRRCR